MSIHEIAQPSEHYNRFGDRLGERAPTPASVTSLNDYANRVVHSALLQVDEDIHNVLQQQDELIARQNLQIEVAAMYMESREEELLFTPSKNDQLLEDSQSIELARLHAWRSELYMRLSKLTIMTIRDEEAHYE